MGAAVRRWLTIRSSTTTSQPSKSACEPEANRCTTLVPTSGNNSRSSRSAASGSTTAGSGS